MAVDFPNNHGRIALVAVASPMALVLRDGIYAIVAIVVLMNKTLLELLEAITIARETRDLNEQI